MKQNLMILPKLATSEMSTGLETSFLNLSIEKNCFCHMREDLKNGQLTNFKLVQSNRSWTKGFWKSWKMANEQQHAAFLQPCDILNVIVTHSPQHVLSKNCLPSPALCSYLLTFSVSFLLTCNSFYDLLAQKQSRK